MESIKSIMLFIVLVSCQVVYAQNREVDLSGKWKFVSRDNLKFSGASFDDSDWKEIEAPADWQKEGFKGYHGLAWYRKSFDLKVEHDDPLYLHLGYVHDVDQVFLNGHFIGQTGDFSEKYPDGDKVERIYELPGKYLEPSGHNVLAVRVLDQGGKAGIAEGEIGIYSYPVILDNSVNLFGTWKFHLFDNMEWAARDLDDSAWNDMHVPGSWEDKGFFGYSGYAWYRKTVALPVDFPSEGMMIVLGKIDDMDEVYINGQLVGATGNMKNGAVDYGEADEHRTYHIPDHVLIPGGKNVIAVRVFDRGAQGGIYEGPVGIVSSSEYLVGSQTLRAGLLDTFD